MYVFELLELVFFLFLKLIFVSFFSDTAGVFRELRYVYRFLRNGFLVFILIILNFVIVCFLGFFFVLSLVFVEKLLFFRGFCFFIFLYFDLFRILEFVFFVWFFMVLFKFFNEFLFSFLIGVLLFLFWFLVIFVKKWMKWVFF